MKVNKNNTYYFSSMPHRSKTEALLAPLPLRHILSDLCHPFPASIRTIARDPA
jgi:hypothetical protein